MPGSISGSPGDDTFMQFNRNMSLGGKFSSTWDFVSASDEFPAGYLFSHGKFLAATILELGTSGFVATGLPGIIGAIRRKRNCRSSV
jgi:hypothetical protein